MLPLLATDMETKTNELPHGIFAMVQQLSCSNFGGKAKIDYLSPRQRFRSAPNNCLHKSSNAKFYPFTERDEDLLQKKQEDVVAGPSVVFTSTAVVQ